MFTLSLTLCFLLCVVFCLCLLNISKKVDLFQKLPSERCIHSKPIPQIGGIAIFVSIFIIDFLVKSHNIFAYKDREINLILWCTVSIIFLLGLLDDILDISAKIKLLFQFMCAVVVASVGVVLELPFLPYSINFLITVGWIIWVTNSINLMDGMDGLAAGVVAIILTSFVFLSLGASPLCFGMLAFIFALAGFMIFNGHPARIFMGDCGSLFLGFAVSIFSISIINERENQLSIFLLVFLSLLVPVVDILIVIYLRWKNEKPIMSADKRHLHHRIFAKTRSQRQSVSYIYILVLVFSCLSVYLANFWNLY